MTDVNEALTQEIELITCMYPEISVKEDHLLGQLDGSLHLSMIPTDGSLIVRYGTETMCMEELNGNSFQFTVRSDVYPDYHQSLTWTLSSPWISEEDSEKIRDLIETEFGMTSASDDVPLVYMLLDHLSHNVISELYSCQGDSLDCLDENRWKDLQRLTGQHLTGNMIYENFDCCICLERKKGSEMVKLPCGEHYLSKDCLKEYYHAMITEGRIENVRCPQCKYEPLDLSSYDTFEALKSALFTPMIPFEFFEGLLSAEDVNRYRVLHRQDACTKLQQHSPHACVPCPRCDEWCVKEAIDDNMMRCRSCDMVFCFNCLHAWHGKHNPCGKRKSIDPEYIEEYADELTTAKRKRELEVKFGKRMMELALDSYLADQLLELALNEADCNMKKCPGCQTIIEKSEGCNKMKCTVCSVMFCFLCGTILDTEDPYAHYNDPMSSCMGKLFEGMKGVDDT